MKNKFKIILVFVLAFVIGMVGGLKFFSSRQALKEIKINNQTIFVEIVKSSQEREKGLSGRESLGPNRGMLFIFHKPGNYLFWMKDMKFNLDFVYINDNKVSDIKENIPYPKPGQQPVVINSKSSFDKVLEISEGMIKKLDIKVGDEVKSNNFLL